tara:strand:+ start:241 stop:1932 length:1692 start_codon:yes stop_codon:yes gene_type:complete
MIQDTTFIICGKEYINQTVGSIKFDKWGEPIACDIRYISHWNDIKNIKLLKKYVFCLQSGTVFTDINKFFEELPAPLLKTGLGHLVFNKETNEVYLHDQALLIESTMLLGTFNEKKDLLFPNFKCSEQHIHHDYTPLTVMREDGYKTIKTSKFGQNIIAEYLIERNYFNNFPRKLRQYKVYLKNKDVENPFKEYVDMIENTLWVFNNEKIDVKKTNKILCTGGGIGWMLQTAEYITICDISVVQLDFITHCLKEWDGENFGQLVFDFIVRNKIKHFHINLKEEQNSNVELLKDKKNVISKINENFEFLVKKYRNTPFKEIWKTVKNKKIITKNKNILECVKDFKLHEINLSNIINFKYNYITNNLDAWQNLISPATKSFIKSCNNPALNPYEDPPCKKINLNVPSDEIYSEIQKIKKFLVTHRDNEGTGWSSFCIHGKSFDATREDEYYNDNRPHVWTKEALEHMPNTINFLKSLNFKSFKRVRVMCLAPKGFINIHRDQTESQLGAINIAINHPEECKFYLEHHGELVFKPGVAYKMNLVNYHTVVNYSNTARYHIIVHGTN